MDANDPERCREVFYLFKINIFHFLKVWTACLDIIPHRQFTFAFIWLMFAQFELRQLNLPGARKILGVAIGKCPKKKLFREYIEIELKLREFDR